MEAEDDLGIEVEIDHDIVFPRIGVVVHNLEPGSVPGGIVQTLPMAFGNMTGRVTFVSLCFILLLEAVWTSLISLINHRSPGPLKPLRDTYDAVL